MHPRCQDARTSTFNRAMDPGGARTLSTAHASAATSFWLEGHTEAPCGAASGEQVPVLKYTTRSSRRHRHWAAVSSLIKPWSGSSLEGKECPSRSKLVPGSLLGLLHDGAHGRDDSGLGAAGTGGHGDDSWQGCRGGEDGGLSYGCHWDG